MPVTYEIDAARGLVRTRCTGRLTAADISGHFAALAADPACPPGPGVLLDMTGLSAPPDTGLVRLTSQEVTRVRERVRFGAVAVVVSGLAAYGMARMGQLLMEDQFAAAQVFRDAAAAEVWLDERIAEAP